MWAGLVISVGQLGCVLHLGCALSTDLALESQSETADSAMLRPAPLTNLRRKPQRRFKQNVGVGPVGHEGLTKPVRIPYRLLSARRSALP